MLWPYALHDSLMDFFPNATGLRPCKLCNRYQGVSLQKREGHNLHTPMPPILDVQYDVLSQADFEACFLRAGGPISAQGNAAIVQLIQVLLWCLHLWQFPPHGADGMWIGMAGLHLGLF